MDIWTTKTYVVDFEGVADGSGLYGMEPGTVVKFNRLEVEIKSFDPDDWYASINAYHDTDANKYGLCYTDAGIEQAINNFISNHKEIGTLVYNAGGSEQGMQERKMFSLDAEVHGDVTLKLLEELGFDIELDESDDEE
jgi:hypothetical protein